MRGSGGGTVVYFRLFYMLTCQHVSEIYNQMLEKICIFK